MGDRGPVTISLGVQMAEEQCGTIGKGDMSLRGLGPVTQSAFVSLEERTQSQEVWG